MREVLTTDEERRPLPGRQVLISPARLGAQGRRPCAAARALLFFGGLITLCSWGAPATSQGQEAAETTAQAKGSREFTWATREFDGRDYVPLRDISAFYQLTYRGVDESEAFTTVILGRQMELALAAGRRQIRVNGVLHWLSFPVRQAGGELYLTTLDLLKTVEPALRPELVPELRVPRVIVLDPGHGGHDKGATSPFGHESDFALDVALKTRDILRREGKLVLMTRDDDTFVPLRERAGFANQWENAVFISIHFNAANFADEANGFEIFCLTPRGGPSTMDRRWRSYFDKTHPADPWANAGLALATCVYHSVLAHMQRRDRGVKRQRFAVLKLTRHPSALVECGFLNNHEESRVAATAKWRQRLAHAIARGLRDYVKMAETRQKPPTLADYQGLSGAVFERRGGQIRLSPNQPRVDVPSRFDHGSPTD